MKKIRIALLTTMALLASFQSSYAGSATWKVNPPSAEWNRNANWTPRTVPDGPDETATFGVSNTTELSSSLGGEVDSIVFEVGASAYTIAMPVYQFSITGTGIVNNSGI